MLDAMYLFCRNIEYCISILCFLEIKIFDMSVIKLQVTVFDPAT